MPDDLNRKSAHPVLLVGDGNDDVTSGQFATRAKVKRKLKMKKATVAPPEKKKHGPPGCRCGVRCNNNIRLLTTKRMKRTKCRHPTAPIREFEDFSNFETEKGGVQWVADSSGRAESQLSAAGTGSWGGGERRVGHWEVSYGLPCCPCEIAAPQEDGRLYVDPPTKKKIKQIIYLFDIKRGCWWTIRKIFIRRNRRPNGSSVSK